jgi:long-subunit acyl-CoA synthetase (AMP-forming)
MCSISVCETKLEQYLETSSVEKVLVWDSKGRSLPKNTMSLEDILEPTSIAQIQKREQKNLYVVTHNPSEKYEADKQQTKNLPAFILSSSGSTGLPKGVVLTHLNITTALTTRYVHTVWSMRSHMSRSITVFRTLPCAWSFLFH